MVASLSRNDAPARDLRPRVVCLLFLFVLFVFFYAVVVAVVVVVVVVVFLSPWPPLPSFALLPGFDRLIQ